MNPDPYDVARVAEGLTEGQRRHLLTAEPGEDGKIRVPVVLGNLNFVTGWPYKFIDPDPRSNYAELTELGLAVRAHLEWEGGR